MGNEVDTLRALVEQLKAENEGLREDLIVANENYEALERVHAEVVADCNELADRNGELRQQVEILSTDLDDMTLELEALSEEHGLALDVLGEHGLIEQVEIDDLKNEDESPLVEFDISKSQIGNVVRGEHWK